MGFKNPDTKKSRENNELSLIVDSFLANPEFKADIAVIIKNAEKYYINRDKAFNQLNPENTKDDNLKIVSANEKYIFYEGIAVGKRVFEPIYKKYRIPSLLHQYFRDYVVYKAGGSRRRPVLPKVPFNIFVFNSPVRNIGMPEGVYIHFPPYLKVSRDQLSYLWREIKKNLDKFERNRPFKPDKYQKLIINLSDTKKLKPKEIVEKLEEKFKEDLPETYLDESTIRNFLNYYKKKSIENSVRKIH